MKNPFPRSLSSVVLCLGILVSALLFASRPVSDARALAVNVSSLGIASFSDGLACFKGKPGKVKKVRGKVGAASNKFVTLKSLYPNPSAKQKKLIKTGTERCKGLTKTESIFVDAGLKKSCVGSVYDPALRTCGKNKKKFRAFRSFKEALLVAGPGDLVAVRSGVYRETLKIAMSGVSGAPVQIASYAEEAPVINGDGVRAQGALISGARVELSGLSFINHSGAFSTIGAGGAVAVGSQGLATLRNLYFANNGSAVGTAAGAGGVIVERSIFRDTGGGVSIVGNHGAVVRYNVFWGGAGSGVAVGGVAGSSATIVHHNIALGLADAYAISSPITRFVRNLSYGCSNTGLTGSSFYAAAGNLFVACRVEGDVDATNKNAPDNSSLGLSPYQEPNVAAPGGASVAVVYDALIRHLAGIFTPANGSVLLDAGGDLGLTLSDPLGQASVGAPDGGPFEQSAGAGSGGNNGGSSGGSGGGNGNGGSGNGGSGSGGNGGSGGSSGRLPGAEPTPPAIPASRTYTLFDATNFVFSGTDPVQQNVAPGTINPERMALVRGTVRSRDGAPLADVAVTVADHPEYGVAPTRNSGLFDLAVNGGQEYLIRYRKAGYLPVDRRIRTTWREIEVAPTVVMIPLDPNPTLVNLATQTTMVVARGGVSNDASGSRQATLLVPPGIQASMELPGGGNAPLTNLTLRATEFTVGATGPAAMPGDLPPSSGYTYALELSVDEAMAVGSNRVNFSEPLPFYVENFLNFPVGMIVPAGYYDRALGRWIASQNGRVIKILAVQAGEAVLQIDAPAVPATASELAALGITSAERTTLANLYPPGTSLWRVPVQHFTPWDCNWPFGPPPDAEPPHLPEPRDDDGLNPDDPTCVQGSIIECENQTLRATVPLPGTNMSLNYSSAHQTGRVAGRRVDYAISGATLPASVIAIETKITVAGRVFEERHDALPNQRRVFVWDGTDAFGQVVNGTVPAKIEVGYVYRGAYNNPDPYPTSFGLYGGSPITGSVARQEIALWQVNEVALSNIDLRTLGVGGWSLSPHHLYGIAGGKLYEGTGSRVLRRIRGKEMGRRGGIPFTYTLNTSPQTDTDNNLIVIDGNRVVRHNPADDTWQVIAGNGTVGFSGDGGPAVQAQLNLLMSRLYVGPNGEIYLSDDGNRRIRMIDRNGIIRTIAGNGSTIRSGDGGPATAAGLGGIVYDMVIDRSGNLLFLEGRDGYFVTYLRSISPEGVIRTVNDQGFGYIQPGALISQTGLYGATRLAVTPRGELVVNRFASIWKFGLDGRATFISGTGLTDIYGLPRQDGDGIPATQASLFTVNGLAVANDESIIFSHRSSNVNPFGATFGSIRRITPEGIITTIAGNSPLYINGTNPLSWVLSPGGVILDTAKQVTLVPPGNIFGGAPATFYTIRGTTPQFALDEVLVPSDDASVVYRFSSGGRHLSTYNALTGAALYTFAYTAEGRIASVTDGNNKTTVIQYNSAGQPTAIVAPYGQVTQLQTNAAGYLSRITSPQGYHEDFTYTPDGLMLTSVDAAGQVHQFAHDSLGRLISDQDPAGGHQTFARVTQDGNFAVSRHTVVGRTTGYDVSISSISTITEQTTHPDGTHSTRTRAADDKHTVTNSTGMILESRDEGDPRYGLAAPYAATTKLRAPSGLELNTTATRGVTLQTSSNPLSVTSVTESKVINGKTFQSLYTGASKTAVSTSPLGRTVTQVFDELGRLLSFTVPGIEPVRYTYNANGKLESIKQGTGVEEREVRYSYNAQGWVSEIVDPVDSIETFSYDGDGRVTTHVLGDGSDIVYQYDSAGRLRSLAPPGRAGHEFRYNPVGLESRYLPPPVTTAVPDTVFTYNSDRQLTEIRRPGGQTITYTYDTPSGRLIQENSPAGQISYNYDSNTGLLLSESAPGGVSTSYTYDGALVTGVTAAGPVGGTVNFSYDSFFRVNSIAVNGFNPITYSYDDDGLMTAIGTMTITRDPVLGRVTGTSTALGVATDAYLYDNFGAVAHYTANAGGGNAIQVQYTYDKRGRITERVEQFNGATTDYDYTYDARGRLITVSRNGTQTAAYTFDANGNRLTKTTAAGTDSATYDAQDRLLTYGGAAFTYTENGELQSKTDAQGVTNYQYDVYGNLLQVQLPGAGGALIEYKVDAHNRRIAKKVNGSFVARYLYESDLRPVAEVDASGNVVARFVYGTRANVPEYMIKNGYTYRIFTDHLGSPRVVVRDATGGGSIVQEMNYDEFGNVTLDTNPGFQPFGFAGGLYDRDTGLVRFGARDYDPAVGRWTAKDPIRFGGGDTNLYGYVLQDPVNWGDPRGLWAVKVCFAYQIGGCLKFGVDDWGAFAQLLVGAGMAGSFDLDASASFDGLSGGQAGFARASCELSGLIGPLEGTINPTYGVDFANPTLSGPYVTPAELRIPEPTGGFTGNNWQFGGNAIIGAEFGIGGLPSPF